MASPTNEGSVIWDSQIPDYMNEHVFQRNRLPPRAYFLPAEHQCLSGKWKFHYALSPLDPEPSSEELGAWSSIDVPGKASKSGLKIIGIDSAI